MGLLGDGAVLLLVIAGFGLLIAIHELGHFVAAKWAGIRVHDFAVGMGPAVLAWRRGIGLRFGSTAPDVRARIGKAPWDATEAELRNAGIGETEYALRALPLGGFVRMLGQDDLDPNATSADPRAYNRRPIGKRMVVVSGGVAANIAIAIVLFIIAFMVGVRFEAPIVGAVAPGSPAAEAGLQPGDRIVSIDGSDVSTFADIQIAGAMSRPGHPLTIVAERQVDGSPRQVTVTVDPRVDPQLGMRMIGIAPSASTTLLSERDALPFVVSAMRRAGFWAGSTAPTPEQFGSDVLAVTLETVAGKPARTQDALQESMAASGGAPVPSTWRFLKPSGPSTVDVMLQPLPVWPILIYADAPADAPADYEVGFAGLTPLTRISRVPAGAPAAAVLRDGDIILRVGDIIGPRQMELRLALQRAAGSAVPLRVLRDGREESVSAPVGRDGRLGVEIAYAFDVPMIARPFDRVRLPAQEPAKPDIAPRTEATPAAALDLLPLTRIDSVGGRAVTDWDSMFTAFRDAAHGGDAVDVPLTWTLPTTGAQPSSGTIELGASDAREIADATWTCAIPPSLFAPLETTLTAHGDPLRAVAMGFRETHKLVMLTYLTIDRLFRGTVGVEQLRGPVGIVHIGTRVANRGITYMIFFLAMISVNLAVLNFLPLPIADGGLMVFLLYEKFRGKPPSPSFQSAATLAGLALVGLLFAVTFYNDIMRLIQ
jgi:regulator of sigma E protease